MFGLGMGEMLLIAIMAIVLFGTNDLPKNLRKVAKGVNDFKKIAGDAQRSWAEVRDDVTRTIMTADLETPSSRSSSALPEGTAEASASDSAGNALAAADDVAVDAGGVTSVSSVDVGTVPSSETFVPDSAQMTPAVVLAVGAVPRSSGGTAVDHDHPHHEERSAESSGAPSSAGGVPKSS